MTPENQQTPHQRPDGAPKPQRAAGEAGRRVGGTIEPKTYRFSTFQELVDVVPADRIRDCMKEMGAAFQASKAATELVYFVGQNLAGNANPPEPKSVIKLPEVFEWVDDNKGEIDATVSTEQSELFTIKMRKEVE